MLIVGFFYYTRYAEAKKALQKIEVLIIEDNYAQAFQDLKAYKTTYTYSKFPKLAEEKLTVFHNNANKELRNGLKLLKSDRSLHFQDSMKFFNDFKEDYSYSDHCNQIDNLLNLINEYKEMDQQLVTGENIESAINTIGDVVDIVELYVFEVQWHIKEEHQLKMETSFYSALPYGR